jgi:hypothetical protein
MCILLHNRGLITIVRLLGGAGGRSSSGSSSNAGTSGGNYNSSSGYMHSDDGGVQDIILDTFIEILAPVRTTAIWLLLIVCVMNKPSMYNITNKFMYCILTLYVLVLMLQ